MKVQLQIKERISAWILLSVFIPMVLLSSLHVHPELALDGDCCHECISHVVHNGHITAPKHTVDCPLCAFQSNLYQGEQEVDVRPPHQLTGVIISLTFCPVMVGNQDVRHGRAPPFSCCA